MLLRKQNASSVTARIMLSRDMFDIRGWQIRRAERYVRAGRTATAEGIYRGVLARRPGQRAALAGLGRLLLRERRFEEAVGIWERAVAVEPQRTNPAFQLARALHRSGRTTAAADQYLRVLALDPFNEKAFAALEQLSDRVARSRPDNDAAVDAAAALAQQLLSLKTDSARIRINALNLLARIRTKSDPDAAFEYWSQLAELHPQSVDPPLQMARIRARQSRNDEALRLFGAVLAREPEHAAALTGYGQVLVELDPAAAIRHFAEWAARCKRDVAPRLELARLYQKSQEWERAEAVYRELLELVPDNPNALSRFAQLLSRDASRTEQALDLWRRLTERDPASPFPLVQRAYLFERARRPAEAEAEYRAALARSPEDAMALFGLARLLSNQARWEEAAALFEALQRVNPSRHDTLLGLGRCLERLDRAEEALVAYQNVLALDPANGNALLYRGRLLRRLGRTEEAIEAWREVCLRTPQNVDAWHELVFMLAGAERDAEALAALDAAEAALPSAPQSWTRLGLAAEAGQFHDRAVAYFERALAAEPHEAIHHTRLGQLYFRQGIVDKAFRHLRASRELQPRDLPVAKRLVQSVHILDTLGIDHLGLAAASCDGDEVLVPERLFRRVREIADREIVAYEPVPRRIIAVTASLAGGGAERQLVNLLRGLSDPAFGLDLALFCISLARRGHRDFFLPLLQGTPVEVVTPAEGAPRIFEAAPYARLIGSFPEDMAGTIAFWLAEFRRRRPQIVHAWQDATNLTAVVAALLAGVPRIVLCTRSVRPDNPRRRLKRFMREAYQAVVGHPSVVLSNNSRAGADDYAEWLGIDPASVAIVHNGIDFERLAATADPARAVELRDSLGIPLGAPVVGSVFRMSEEKRPLLWVEAAAEIAAAAPRAHFVVCGDGPMRAEMSDLSARLGIADRLHLPGPQDEIGSWYQAMDVAMLASRHEGLPNVLLEAQSLGVPVVVPDVGGVGETVLSGVTGWTVRDADARALAERALYCLTDRAWAAAARIEAPAFVRRHFGIETMLRRTLEVYGIAPACDTP